jgi:hypothetical protein
MRNPQTEKLEDDIISQIELYLTEETKRILQNIKDLAIGMEDNWAKLEYKDKRELLALFFPDNQEVYDAMIDAIDNAPTSIAWRSALLGILIA